MSDFVRFKRLPNNPDLPLRILRVPCRVAPEQGMRVEVFPV